jgi:DNA-3-methyladenine glycosylase II
VVTSPQPPDVRHGFAWLREADPVLARVIDEQPAFDPDAWIQSLPPLDLFGALVFQVVGQQISVIAATAIFARLVEHFGGRAPNPDDLVSLDPETLREIGLSRQKAHTVRDLAQRFRDGRLSEAEVGNLSDEEAIRELTAVKGVGPWTAKGALLIALRRPDLVRTDDVALRHAIQASYGLDHLPDPDEVAALAQRWSPYGSLASSLLLAAARPVQTKAGRRTATRPDPRSRSPEAPPRADCAR